MNDEAEESSRTREFLLEGWSLEFEAPTDLETESLEAKVARTIQASSIGELVERHACKITKPITISNAIIEGPLHLKNVIFECEVSVTGCRFTSDVDFSFAVFRRAASFDGSQFCRRALFRAVHAESYFRICRTDFEDEASFVDLRVDEILDAESASFRSVRFDRMRVFKGALFRPFSRHKEVQPEVQESDIKPVRFAGAARFWNAHIGGTAEFDGAQFEGEANFECIQIDGNALFHPDRLKNRVRFLGNALFLGARIGGTAEFDGAQFQRPAKFERIKIGASALFRADDDGNPIRFDDEVTFFGAHIQFNAEFFGAEFTKDAVFEHFQVDGDAFFGPDAESSGDAAQFHPAQFYGKAVFNMSSFKGLANFREVHFAKETVFDGTTVYGSADFRGSVFEGSVSFREAGFRAVRFRDHIIETALQGNEQFKNIVDLRGFTYERIGVAWRELFGMPGPYDRQPYTHLERVLRSSGYDREADDVYFLRREREAEHLCAQASVRDWPHLSFDRFQRILFHYGIRPYRLLVFCVVFILAGAYVFAQRGAVMNKDREERKNDPIHLTYPQALGVSFRLFIPIVEIPSGGQWVPTEHSARVLGSFNLSYAGYASFHRLAGAVLVPLGVAALTGLIRRREKA